MNVKTLLSKVKKSETDLDTLHQAIDKTRHRIADIDIAITESKPDAIAGLAKDKAALLVEVEAYQLAVTAEERRQAEAAEQLAAAQRDEAKAAALQRCRRNTRRLHGDVITALDGANNALKEIEMEAAVAIAENSRYGSDIRAYDMNFHQLYSGSYGLRLQELLRHFRELAAQLEKTY